jgi:hypothetical protein
VLDHIAVHVHSCRCWSTFGSDTDGWCPLLDTDFSIRHGFF